MTILNVNSLMQRLDEQISRDRMMNWIQDLAQFHRIQITQGYHDAAEYCNNVLQGIGIQSEIRQYSTKDIHPFWSQQLFDEWIIRKAHLELIEPQAHAHVLANYHKAPLSIIQRSIATSREGLEAEVVDVGLGTRPAHYEGKDVRDRFVLATGNVSHVLKLAVDRYGAVGIISAGGNVEDAEVRQALRYASFWWDGSKPRGRGFVISPSQAQALRELIDQQKNSGKAVRLRAVIDADFQPGTLEVVTGLIPGKGAQELLLTAHLCHPAPGADDNASGVSVLMETVSCFHSLVNQGAFTRPRLGIRFLLMPEFTGTYAYLAERAEAQTLHDIVGALNIDMVGANQARNGGTFLLMRTPDAFPSYLNIILPYLMKQAIQHSATFSSTHEYADFRWNIAAFGDGSDNHLLTDPAVGIPTVGLVQWPSRIYHSSLDTPNICDPAMLKRAAMLATSYVYLMSTADHTDALLFGHLLLEQAGLVLSPIWKQESPHYAPQELLHYRYNMLRQALDSLGDLLHPKERTQTLKLWQTHLTQRYQDTLTRLNLIFPSHHTNEDPTTKAPHKEWKLVPIRVFPVPVSLSQRYMGFNHQDWDEYLAFRDIYPNTRKITTQAYYWINGKRTITEIAKLVAMETGIYEPNGLVAYFQLLEKHELLRFQ